MLEKIQFWQTLSECSGDTRPGLVEKKQTGTQLMSPLPNRMIGQMRIGNQAPGYCPSTCKQPTDSFVASMRLPINPMRPFTSLGLIGLSEKQVPEQYSMLLPSTSGLGTGSRRETMMIDIGLSLSDAAGLQAGLHVATRLGGDSAAPFEVVFPRSDDLEIEGT